MRVVVGLMFFPRGGSAHVARALATQLAERDWEVTIVSGSGPGRRDARAFYEGLDVVPVDFATGDAPQHPSYEDRPDAPDPVFASVDDEAYEVHVAAWTRALERAGAAEADVLHLHHLTPLNEAAERVAPGVPVVGHLHGTELLMLERIAEGPPPSWRHALAWQRRMRRWAAGCRRLLVLSGTQVERAQRLLGVDRRTLVVSANGFDPRRFHPLAVDRRAFWHQQLVADPHGWRPGGEEGSIRYGPEEAERVAAGTVLLAVGRFTAVKRTGLLIRAFTLAQRRLAAPTSLVLLGGYPDEWEGEHPVESIEASGAPEVYLAGWHDQRDLPRFYAASDVVVLASVAEQFGSVLVEGMACGLPPIAVDRLGPKEIISAGETGWLVPPDDLEALAGALTEAVDDPEERHRRGAAARVDALERFSWPAIAERVDEILREVAGPPSSRRAAYS